MRITVLSNLSALLFVRRTTACIYCDTDKYRKIYENHIGPIPKDDQGRSYEIHHIDGNRNNNKIENLKCVSIQEHYDIHLSQGDWAAAMRIAQKLKKSQKEISDLSSKSQLDRIKKGTHHFIGGELQRQNSKRHVENGTHNFLGNKNPVHERIKSGNHPFIGGELQRQTNLRRIEAGDHPFLDGEATRRRQLEKVSNGTHHFCGPKIAKEAAQKRFMAGTHQNQTIRTCPHCAKIGKGPGMLRYHFDNCKNKKTEG